jgi:hypothetical protein
MPFSLIAKFRANGEKLHRVVGSAISQTGGWALPVPFCYLDPATGLNEYKKAAEKLRKEWGLRPTVG